MAVGRGSMERAARAAGTDTVKKAADNKGQTPTRRMTISEIVGETSTVEPPAAARRPADKAVGNKVTAVRQSEKSKAAENKPEVKSKPVVEEKPVEKTESATEKKSALKIEPAVEKKPVVKTEAAAQEKPVAEKTEKEAVGEIVYQKSSGMLERAANANESFGLGDAMPVYYF